MSTWNEKLADYKFVKWDLSMFDKNTSKWVSEAFESKKYAFASDYIRVYALYTYGGIYLDMDVEVLKTFDELLDADYMLAYENQNANSIEAGCFGFAAGSSFLKLILNYYDVRSFINEKGQYDTTPLPQIMSQIISTNNLNFEVKDWHTFTNKSFETGQEYVSSNSFAIHHFAGSWKTKYEKKDIRLHQKLVSKYGYMGEVIYKVKRYLFHPMKLINKVFKKS